MDKTNEIINELNDMANFKGFGESEEEILNADGSRNWQANILLDNVKRLEQENKELAHYLACMTEQRNKANTTLKEIKAIISGDYEMLDPQALQEIRSIITKAEEE